MIKPRNKADVGRIGEKLACRFLRKNGYKILENNKRESHKEIDIIAANKEYIVFVEVKTRSVEADLYSDYGSPASAVNKKKQSNLIYAANAYLSNRHIDKQPRMDVIEVYLEKNSGKLLIINHIENAYSAR